MSGVGQGNTQTLSEFFKKNYTDLIKIQTSFIRDKEGPVPEKICSTIIPTPIYSNCFYFYHLLKKSYLLKMVCNNNFGFIALKNIFQIYNNLLNTNRKIVTIGPFPFGNYNSQNLGFCSFKKLPRWVGFIAGLYSVINQNFYRTFVLLKNSTTNNFLVRILETKLNKIKNIWLKMMK